MTHPHLLAVFTALTLLCAPFHTLASEDALVFSEVSSTVVVTLPIQETPSSTALSTPELLEVMTATTTTDTPSGFTSSTELTETSPPVTNASSSPVSLNNDSSLLESTTASSATGTICLAIIAPHPNEGAEWIAFYGLTPSSSHRILQWSIYDAQSSLITIATSTPLLWDEPTQTLRVHLRSARLNNNGDTVTLKNTFGEIHDTFTYTKVERDQRWLRERCDVPWHIVPEPVIEYISETPVEPPTSAPPSATANADVASEVIQPPLMAIEVSALPPSAPLIIQEERETAPPPLPTVNIETQTAALEKKPPAGTTALEKTSVLERLQTTNTPLLHNEKVSTSGIVTSPSSSSMKHTPTAPTASAASKRARATSSSSKKNAANKSTKITVHSPPMSSVLDRPAEYQGIRVRITGTVVSSKKLIGAHKFVLLNSDGKGLLVHAKTTAPTPERGQFIQITGIIAWNDEGVWLKQQAQDTWETLQHEPEESSADFALHTATLDAPGQEDAWSHIEVEGKIRDVQNGSFDIETEDGVPLRVRLPKLLGYRAGRLESHDTVRVRGLLDTRGIEPVLLPQVVEDIQILERAPLASPKDARPAQAPWLPVGIIAGTLATNETLRRAKTWYKKQQEERAFATFLQTNPQNQH